MLTIYIYNRDNISVFYIHIKIGNMKAIEEIMNKL